MRRFLRQKRLGVGRLARQADGAFESFGRTRVPARRKVKLVLDWLQASAPDAGDGEVLLLKGSKVRLAATGLDNGRQVVRSLTLGLASGGDGSGSILFDNYTSSP